MYSTNFHLTTLPSVYTHPHVCTCPHCVIKQSLVQGHIHVALTEKLTEQCLCRGAYEMIAVPHL